MKKLNKDLILIVLGIPVAVLVVLFLSVFWTITVYADRSPATCVGSGLAINLYTDKPQVSIGDVISYSVDIFNGTDNIHIACDATDITAFVVTPDGVTHPITLLRTSLLNLEVDFYSNVVTYIAQAEDVQSDGTLKASANDSGVVHQNDTNSTGGGRQEVNTTITVPIVLEIIPEVVLPLPPRGGSSGSRPTPPIVLTASVIDTIPEPVPPPVVVAVVSVPSLPKTGFFSDHASILWDSILLLGNLAIFFTALFVIFKKRTV